MNSLRIPGPMQTPEFERLSQQCIHCGLCLQACPTYVVSGQEADSPRGRIALMRAAAFGQAGLEGAFETHIDLCLACRSCETACPSGVQYGSLVEMARQTLSDNRHPGILERFIRWLALDQLLPHIERLKLLARFLQLYQRSGLSRLVRSLPVPLPARLRTMEGLLPQLPSQYPDYRQPAPAHGLKRGRVAFFYGCMQEAFLAGVNAATIRVLQENGYEIHFPENQTCCGAASLHVGETGQAIELARQNIDAFMKAAQKEGPFEAIINNAGGCGAVLKEYAHLLRDDPSYVEKAQNFVSQLRDINEFLSEVGIVPPRGEVRARVTYSDSCHLRHVQKVIAAPRDLLRAIPGIELVELSHPELCCGSAGVYNIVHTETANAILDQKMRDIQATGAELIVTTNTGCHFQLVYGVQRAGSRAQVVHLVELLDRSYQAAKSNVSHPE